MAKKSSIAELDLLGKNIARLRKTHAQMKLETSKVWDKIEHLNDQMKDLMINNEKTSWQVKSAGTFTLNLKTQCKIAPDAKDEVRDWLISSKDPALNRSLLTVNSQTVGATIREELEHLDKTKKKQLETKLKQLQIELTEYRDLSFSAAKSK